MNFLIHRTFMWFAVVTALVGVYSVYLGCWDHDNHYNCLPHASFVYVFYGIIEFVMSVWLVSRMGDHIQQLKMKRAIAYWNNYHATNKATASGAQ